MENVMLKYEALIFNMGSNEENHNGNKNLNPIDWKMSASECILNGNLKKNIQLRGTIWGI